MAVDILQSCDDTGITYAYKYNRNTRMYDFQFDLLILTHTLISFFFSRGNQNFQHKSTFYIYIYTQVRKISWKKKIMNRLVVTSFWEMHHYLN